MSPGLHRDQAAGLGQAGRPPGVGLTTARDGHAAHRGARAWRLDARIVTIAAEQFLANGYTNTSMSAVSAALGGSKGTLYRYYPSKEMLFGAVVAAVCRGHRATAGRPHIWLEARETLNWYGARYADCVFDDRMIALARIIVGEVCAIPVTCANLFFSTLDTFKISLEADLRCVISGARRNGPDLQQICRSFVSLISSHDHQKAVAMRDFVLTDEDIAGIVETSVDLIMSTLAPYHPAGDRA